MSFTSVLKSFFVLGALGIAAQGCVVVGPGGGGNLPAYARGCTYSDDCSTGSCQQANTFTAGSSIGQYFCTNSCSVGNASPCPAGSTGAQVCVSTGGLGQCYMGCFADRTCPAGYAAGMDPSGTCFCIPN